MTPAGDVWSRFANLAAYCRIEIDHNRGQNHRWKVSVSRDGAAVSATGDELLAVVDDVLAQAEQRGWHVTAGRG